jgi:hypothetical protein
MKVLLGWMEQQHGTVETSSQGLIYAGRNPEHVQEQVELKRAWYDRISVMHTLSDEELVRSLPYRMQGWLWAVFLDKQGVIQDQPEYDPFGDLWRNP